MYKNKKIILISLLALIFLIFLFYSPKTVSKEISIPIVEVAEDKKDNIAFLEIDDQKYESNIVDNISVYDFMDSFRQKGEINFIEKNYTGMGKFIVSINGVKNSGDKNWIYYVNNKKAEIGVSNYKIKKEDVVSWKFEKGIY